MDAETIAQCINTLGDFCGPRDIPAPTPQALRQVYGREQADVCVLFGGSIPCGGDVLAAAMRSRAARHYLIVGGEGHTTETLRRKIHRAFPEIETAGLPEAEVFARYLRIRHRLAPDYLECHSTNCGNNITCLLDLLRAHRIDFHSVILCQDATMQRRMDAGFRRYAPHAAAVNYAAYRTRVVARDGRLQYARAPWGMWKMEEYVALLMGEIPRLCDGPDGYGPRGKGYIAHVDVPPAVLAAFARLRENYGDIARKANPLYASRE